MKLFQRWIFYAAASLVLALAASVTRAQGVVLTNKAEREIEAVEKGAKVKKLVPPQKMVPGDEVIYTVTYINKGAKPAEAVTVTNPIPKFTRYRDGSAAGDNTDITFSVDDDKTFATPDKLMLIVKDKSGKDTPRSVTGADYTHIRWVVKQNVAPGQSGSVRFRAAIL